MNYLSSDRAKKYILLNLEVCLICSVCLIYRISKKLNWLWTLGIRRLESNAFDLTSIHPGPGRIGRTSWGLAICTSKPHNQEDRFKAQNIHYDWLGLHEVLHSVQFILRFCRSEIKEFDIFYKLAEFTATAKLQMTGHALLSRNFNNLQTDLPSWSCGSRVLAS